jgi:hypothetical protein
MEDADIIQYLTAAVIALILTNAVLAGMLMNAKR